ncbi:short-chain dehydrogenase [Panaeolus papilionaceus]|nr:short-chain dehydrogenase [Panaeolus papilionaceus]
MQPTIWQFIRSQWATTPPAPHEDLSGKTVVVVGANVGLGFEAAKHFASMNPGMLILACRDKKRGEDASQQIKQATGCKNIYVWLVDLKDHASVNAFADRFEKDNVRLDILVANAAVIPANPTTPEAGPDGWEVTFLVNNLSTNLLCLLLLPRLLKTAREYDTIPRLVVVSSGMHYYTKLGAKVESSDHPVRTLGKADTMDRKDFAADKRYGDTKLLNVLFVRALSDRLRNQPLVVDAVCPGYCYSSLRRSYKGARAVVDWLMERALARTTEEGSRQLVWAALAMQNEPEKLRGAFISSMQVVEPSDYVVSQTGSFIQDKIWDDMLVELEKINPKVKEIASICLAH